MRLEKLLAALDVDVEPFAICDVRAGWSVAMPPAGSVTLHFNLAGEGLLRMDDATVHRFGPDTLLVIPPKVRHRVELPEGRESGELRAEDAPDEGEGLRRIVAGDGKPGVLLACGNVRVTYGGGFGVFDELRQPLVVAFEDEAVRNAFGSLLREQEHPGPGSATLMKALMTQCLVALFRRLCDEGDCALPWLAALDDPRVGRAVDAVLDDPSASHTLESLAKASAMSRSAFADRFSRLFGRPPMDFVREVRLRRAAALLRSTDLPVKAVADRVGFASRSHFSRAFRGLFGVDPAGFRGG